MTAARTTYDSAQISTWLRRIRAEYRESPGLRLTLPQARRLFGLDDSTGAELLDELVSAGFLTKTPAGAYARRDVV